MQQANEQSQAQHALQHGAPPAYYNTPSTAINGPPVPVQSRPPHPGGHWAPQQQQQRPPMAQQGGQQYYTPHLHTGMPMTQSHGSVVLAQPPHAAHQPRPQAQVHPQAPPGFPLVPGGYQQQFRPSPAYQGHPNMIRTASAPSVASHYAPSVSHAPATGAYMATYQHPPATNTGKIEISSAEIARQQQILDDIQRRRAGEVPAHLMANSTSPQIQSTPLQPPRRKSRFGRFLPTEYMASLWGGKSSEKAEGGEGEASEGDGSAGLVPGRLAAIKQKEKDFEPLAVSSDGSVDGFFGHEMANNEIVKLLMQPTEENATFINEILARQAILLVPQNVNARKYVISRSFLRTHAIVTIADSPDGSLFSTFNGIVGCFDPKRERISIQDMSGLQLGSPAGGEERKSGTVGGSSPAGSLSPREKRNSAANGEEKEGKEEEKERNPFPDTIVTDRGTVVPRVQLLREGQLQFPNTPAPLGVILVSDVLWARESDCIKEESAESLMSPRSAAAKTERLVEEYKVKILHSKTKNLRLGIKKFIANFKKNPFPPPEVGGPPVLSFVASAYATIKAHPLWQNASAEELEVAKAGITRTIFTQLYDTIYGPPEHRKLDSELSAHLSKLWFVTPGHLDIFDSDWDENVWKHAKDELDGMNSVKAPREKLQRLLNCCTIIIRLLNSKGGVAGADDFLPHLIYAIIYANPSCLHSNMEFIKTYCKPDDELAESFYYLTILESAVYFIENITGQLVDMPEEFFAALMQAEIEIPPSVLLTKEELNQWVGERLDVPLPELPPKKVRGGPRDLLSDDEEGPVDDDDILQPTPMSPRGAEERQREDGKEDVAVEKQAEEKVEAEERKEEAKEEVVGGDGGVQIDSSLARSNSSDVKMLEKWQGEAGAGAAPACPRCAVEDLLPTKEVPEEATKVLDTIDLLCTTMGDAPFTYAEHEVQQLGQEDVVLLLAEYKQMAAMLSIVKSLRSSR